MAINYTATGLPSRTHIDKCHRCCIFHPQLPYFFGYKMEFFSFQNNLKDLDPSCKMDLDLWDCLGRVKLVL